MVGEAREASFRSQIYYESTVWTWAKHQLFLLTITVTIPAMFVRDSGSPRPCLSLGTYWRIWMVMLRIRTTDGQSTQLLWWDNKNIYNTSECMFDTWYMQKLLQQHFPCIDSHMNYPSLLSFLWRWGNCSTEKLNDLVEIMHQISDRTRSLGSLPPYLHS